MPYKKGHTNNPAGKPKGTKSKKTLEWESLGGEIIGKGADRFKRVLNEMEDEEFIKSYLMILEYFKPKQQRTEVESTHKITTDFSTMTTDELKDRAEALNKLNDPSITDTTGII